MAPRAVTACDVDTTVRVVAIRQAICQQRTTDKSDMSYTDDEMTFKVIQGYWQLHYSTDCIAYITSDCNSTVTTCTITNVLPLYIHI